MNGSKQAMGTLAYVWLFVAILLAALGVSVQFVMINCTGAMLTGILSLQKE
jgi:hypothetical protein